MNFKIAFTSISIATMTMYALPTMAYAQWSDTVIGQHSSAVAFCTRELFKLGLTAFNLKYGDNEGCLARQMVKERAKTESGRAQRDAAANNP